MPHSGTQPPEEGSPWINRYEQSPSLTGRVLGHEYPKHQQALASIIANARPDDPQMFGLVQQHLEITRSQEQWVREAQRAGAFRDFDPSVMVLAIQGAREAAITRARVDPDFDTAACARELADIFDHATRRQS